MRYLIYKNRFKTNKNNIFLNVDIPHALIDYLLPKEQKYEYTIINNCSSCCRSIIKENNIKYLGI